MSAPPGSDRFRAVLGHFPTSVVAVTALERAGTPVGMTVGSFFSVSLDPLLVGFCPARTSTTFPKIRTAPGFAVNLLAHDQEWICRRLAARGADKLRGIGWRPAPSGAPVIEGALAWLDCTFADVHEAGDHYVVLGAVAALEADGDGAPLVFLKGALEPVRRGSGD
ncbi:flavin reductase family protein [Amycolatopsis sp. SID8362]|uniref:flavin reductase family protein n=1 Tax=Amycolatopsis sp. SID8362 TaxID=2690346 RepID=UPI00136EBDAD|nr:flavin reductase family protein [Amycolatopsis sp. SID8362]NBH07416.1 flavin reductase [Amycolatopsis sp. SID8362]NED44112.1 flavin reductase family protein [Amycolatopsis sp. SID8362]